MNGNQMEFDEDLMMDFNGVIVLKYNNTSKYSAIFNSGISVTIEKVEDVLQMILLVPPMFKGGYTDDNIFIDFPPLFKFSHFGSLLEGLTLWTNTTSCPFKAEKI